MSSADLDTFKEIEDAYKAADSSISTTVTNLQSSHNSDIASLDSRLDTAEAKSSFTDPTTQTLLTAEAAARAAADTAIIATATALQSSQSVHRHLIQREWHGAARQVRRLQIGRDLARAPCGRDPTYRELSPATTDPKCPELRASGSVS